jgi:hypothetical protein
LSISNDPSACATPPTGVKALPDWIHACTVNADRSSGPSVTVSPTMWRYFHDPCTSSGRASVGASMGPASLGTSVGFGN